MNNEEEKTMEIDISKFLFVALNILPPLVLGKFFGVTAERFAYGLIILLLALRYAQMVDVLSEIKNAAEELQEMMDKEQE